MEGIEEADPYGNYEWLASKRRKMEDVETIEATKSPHIGPKSVYKFKLVIKSASDKRIYRVFTLANKMKIVLISDPDSVKSAAALSIQAGSMSDPKEFPGMAHLCERMLFAGNSSVTNSDETCFETFLQKYDGEYTSYTQKDLAVHVFDVNPAAFHASLDRFARYFICPTFPRNSLEEEVDGIQAECDSRAANDEDRRALVAALLTKADHPFSRFDCGNKETLWNKPLKEGSVDTLRSELVKFYTEHYSSNLMCLAVLGVESCDELQKMVENIFQYVDNTNKAVPRWGESPYGPLQFMTKIEIVPLQPNLRKLFLIFPIPDFTKHYKTGAILYLRYVLGYEGPGSLVTTLKRENFIKKLEVEYEQPGTGFAFITLDFQLTKNGQEDLDRVITHLFQYVKMIRKEGPQRRLWEEMKAVNETKFRFLPHESPINYVENLVTLMPVVPQEEILSCRYLLSESKLELIRDLFNFISPNRMRMITSWPENIQVADEVDEWFGCKYKYSTIDDKLIQRWNHCYLYPEFKSPPPNPFVATMFDLKARDTKAENNLPRLLDENELTRIWFLQDSVFREPKATIIMHVISPLPKHGPSEFNLTRLMAKTVEDALLEFSSAAAVAGFMFNVEASIAGFTTTVHGYDHKIHILFNYVLNRLFHFVSFGNVGCRFEAIKAAYLEELEQWSQQEPYLHASEYVDQLLNHDFWSVDELLLSMKDDSIPPARLVAFAQKFFAQVKLEWFFHGNFTEKESLRICQSSLEYFRCVNSRPIPPSKIKDPQEIILESGSAIYQAEHKGSGINRNRVSCAALVLQTDLSCMKDKVVIELIESILYDPAYNIVPGRDKLIWTDTRKTRASLALIIVVQATKEVAVLEESMESFLNYMHKELKSMSREEFLEHRVGLALKKANKNKSLWDRGVEMFQEIFKEQYDFDSYNVELRELQKITLSDLSKFYEEWILPASNKRKKLCIHVVPAAPAPAATDRNAVAPTNPLMGFGIPKEEQKIPRENLYTATNSTRVPQNNSIIQRWTPSVKNSIRDDICTRGSTALSAFARSSNVNTGPRENNAVHSGGKATKACEQQGKHNAVPKNDNTSDEDAEEDPNDDSSSDSNESTMIKEYYFKIEEEIRALSNLKRHLLSGLRKAGTENQDKSEETIAANSMIAEGGEAQQEEKEKIVEKDVEANIEFERLPPLHLHPDQLHLPSEFNVYTLTSIESSRQRSNSSNHSNPKINNKNGKGKNRYKESSEDENYPARSSSRRHSPRPNPSKMPSRARLSRDSTLKKESGEKSNPRSRPSSSTYKTKPVNKEPRAADSRFQKSDSRVPDKKSETKVPVKKHISTSESEPERPKPRKVKTPVKPSQDTLTETLKKTISEMDDVEEIEELDFDIQKEIIRLQKLRTLLDAKAKRILNKESVPKAESESRAEKKQKHPNKKTKESTPSLENNPADSPENVPSIKSVKSKTKCPRGNNKRKQRTTTLYKCLQELRTNLTDEEYQHIIDASEDKLKATIKQYQQGTALPDYDANENLFVSGDKDSKDIRDPELINWLRGTVVEEEKLNIHRSMLKTRKEIDCLNNTYLLSATLDPYSFNSQSGKLLKDGSPMGFLNSNGNFSDLPSNIIQNDPSLQPKVTINKSEINKENKNLVRKPSVPRKISNLKALKTSTKATKNVSSKFSNKDPLKPFRFGLGRLTQKNSKESSSKASNKNSKNPYPLKPVRKPSQNSNECAAEEKMNDDFNLVKSVSSDESCRDSLKMKVISKGKSPGGDSDGDSSSGGDQTTRRGSLKDFQFNVGQQQGKKHKKAEQVKKEDKEKDQIKAVSKFKEDLKTSQRKGSNKVKSDAKNPKIKLDDMSPKEFGVKHRREVAAEKKKNLNNDMAEFKNLSVPPKEHIVKTVSLNSTDEDSETELRLPTKDENTVKSDKVGDSVSAEIIAVVKARDDRSSTESVAEDVSKTNANPARVKIINDIRKWRKTMQLYAKQKSLQD